MPAKMPVSGFPAAISFGSAAASILKYSTIGARLRATPNPWLLCMLRLSAAISPYDSPSSGLKPSTSSLTSPLTSSSA